jgi:hypothetical protein
LGMKRERLKRARKLARATYTHRLVIFEQPSVVKRLEELALASGHSVSAEVRYAVRRHLLAYEEDR